MARLDRGAPPNRGEQAARHMRLEICGSIAAGKTTLASLLGALPSSVLLENFQANPFWESFYSDPVANSFETEVTFLLQHYHLIKSTALAAVTVCDFSLYLDLAYSRITLSAVRLNAFNAVYRQVESELGPPDLLVYLQCDPAIELERIKRRGRAPEASITTGYLRDIASHLEALLAEQVRPSTLHVIDSGTKDFAYDVATRRATVDEISGLLSSLRKPG
jgi:deoxyadenosine/deoxycytidine kinase